jgi:hypothetical protein
VDRTDGMESVMSRLVDVKTTYAKVHLWQQIMVMTVYRAGCLGVCMHRI